MVNRGNTTTADAVRRYGQGLGRRARTSSAGPKAPGAKTPSSKRSSGSRGRAAPFRRTFDSATAAAELFYAQNLDFLQPILDRGEPREAVREWLRSNAHGRTGRMKVRDLSQTPWAKKMVASADPVRAALRNVFGHAKGRRWDRVDWDAIRALGETLVEFAGDRDGTGLGGWTWFPIAIEDDDAKILDRLSVEGEPEAYRQFASSLSAREVKRVVETYAAEVQRLARCMPASRRRPVEARLKEIQRWLVDGIPQSVCGQSVYAGHTCDLEPLHGELIRLRDACESDAAYQAWRNEAVRRSPRRGSVAEADVDDVPVELVPASAFDDEAPVSAERCTPSEAARVMGRLGAAKRRENAAKRRALREANEAARAVEREAVSKARAAQRERRRKTPPPQSPAPRSHRGNRMSRRAQTRGSDFGSMTTSALQSLLAELERQRDVGSWPQARRDAHALNMAGAMDELLARSVLTPVPRVNPRPKPAERSTPRWVALRIAGVLEARFAKRGHTWVAGPAVQASVGTQSVYVVQDGVFVGDGTRRARLTVRRDGDGFAVEVVGMPPPVATLVTSAAKEVLGARSMRLQGSDDGLRWRRA